MARSGEYRLMVSSFVSNSYMVERVKKEGLIPSDHETKADESVPVTTRAPWSLPALLEVVSQAVLALINLAKPRSPKPKNRTQIHIASKKKNMANPKSQSTKM